MLQDDKNTNVDREGKYNGRKVLLKKTVSNGRSLETSVLKEVKSPMACVNDSQTKCPYSNASGTQL